MLPRPQKQAQPPGGGTMQHDKSSGSGDHRLKPVVDGSLNLVVSPQTVVVPTTDPPEGRGRGGEGAGGGTYKEDQSHRLGGVALPPSSSTFRRLKEHRDQQEEFVIRERYLSRPAPLGLGGEDEAGQQPRIKYQAWTATPGHAHIGPRQSSTMLTPQTPDDFRLRVLRTTESMKGGAGSTAGGCDMSPPSNDHAAILYSSPSSFYNKQARMSDSTSSPRPSPHPSAVATPPNQDLRYHPFAQDSLFCHRPNKPFKAGPEPSPTLAMTTNLSGGSAESPAHFQYQQSRQSPLARPPQKQPSSSSVDKQDLKSHSPQQQQTWHRPVRDTPPTRTSDTPPTSSLAPVKIAKDAAAASVVVDFPTHFRLGTLIQLSNGDLKTVETLTTLDFVQSAETSPEVKIDHSVVTTLDLDIDKGMANITFSVGKQKVQVPLPITRKHHPTYRVGYRNLYTFITVFTNKTVKIFAPHPVLSYNICSYLTSYLTRKW